MAKARKPSVDVPTPAPVIESYDLNDRDRIAARAYELYLERGGADGGDFDDWLAAERELSAPNGNGPGRDAGE